MNNLIKITLIGIIKDRIFQGILTTALIFLAIPAVSSLSMRQGTELSITLSLSLISFILLLLSVFLGGTLLWKDIERRYYATVLGLPLSRREYLTGKFFGVSIFLMLTALVLGLFATLSVFYVSGLYPPAKPVVWSTFFLCILFDAMKYILLVAYAFLFSTVSTSFFLPIFGTIAIFLAGTASQEVHNYINSVSGQKLPPLFQSLGELLYYILPNFSAFDLKINAIYGIAIVPTSLLLIAGYFLVCIAIVLTISSFIFSRRQLS